MTKAVKTRWQVKQYRTIDPTMMKGIGDTKRPCNPCQATMKDSTRGSIVVRGPFKQSCFWDSKIILVEFAYKLLDDMQEKAQTEVQYFFTCSF